LRRGQKGWGIEDTEGIPKKQDDRIADVGEGFVGEGRGRIVDYLVD
jgi:hypothetical protein